MLTKAGIEHTYEINDTSPILLHNMNRKDIIGKIFFVVKQYRADIVISEACWVQLLRV